MRKIRMLKGVKDNTYDWFFVHVFVCVRDWVSEICVCDCSPYKFFQIDALHLERQKKEHFEPGYTKKYVAPVSP